MIDIYSDHLITIFGRATNNLSNILNGELTAMFGVVENHTL